VVGGVRKNTCAGRKKKNKHYASRVGTKNANGGLQKRKWVPTRNRLKTTEGYLRLGGTLRMAWWDMGVRGGTLIWGGDGEAPSPDPGHSF